MPSSLPLQLRQDEPDRLRGAGRGRDQVDRGRPRPTQVLVRQVEDLWSFVYAWIVVMKPCSIPKASCSTFASGATQFVVHEAFEIDVVRGRVVLVVVDAEHERDVGLGRRRRDDDLLRAGVDVLLRVRRASVKKPVDSSTTSTPRSPHGSAAGSRSASILISKSPARIAPSPHLDVLAERPEDGVVLEQVRHRLRVAEVVRRDDLEVAAALADARGRSCARSARSR